MDYGRNIIGTTGIPLKVLADGLGEWFPIGTTVDWGTVAAVGSDTVLQPEGVTVKNGQKYLRYGQVLCQITNQPVQTLTITATGGTYQLSGYRPDTGAYVVTAPIAYNAVNSAIQAALADPAVFGPIPATVAGTGPFTITGPVGTLTPITGSLTGGSATMALTTPIANGGMWGPFDPTASDGRQSLVRGQCGVVNQTWIQNGVLGFITTQATSHPSLLVGGLLWKPRVIMTTGAHSLAAGPTVTEVEAAFPRVNWAGGMSY